MKGLRIGRRRARTEQAASPLELALRPALVDGRWQVPDRFNFTRDVVEALAGDPKRNAVTILGKDGVIEPRTFLEIAEAAARRAATLAEHGVHPKDRVIVMAETSMHWLELVLGIWKAGAVAVPALPSLSTPALEALHASTGASLVVAEQRCSGTIEQMSFAPEVLYVDEESRRRPSSMLKVAPTHDTSSRDLALVFTSPGTGGTPKEIGHTHAAVFAARVQAEHWLDAGRGDVVWCTADADSPLAAWFTLAGPWSRGAETVIHQGEFDPQERLEHLYRVGPTILCQSAAEYRALAMHEKLERFRTPRLRRLVSTGDVLEPEVVEIFQERWGLAINDGYGQAEASVVVGDGRDGMWKAGSIGRALPGYDIAIVDDQGSELPNGVEGDLVIRGHPPTLFAGYWDAPDDTKRAFRGDLYLTGDVAVADEEGFLTYVARAEDVITSSGRTFGPYEVEHVLRSHDAIAAGAVVGIRDLQRGGHFVRAFVVPVPGTEGTEQLEAELRQFLGQVLPEQQVPREIVFVEALPIIRGRLSRSVLRDRPLPGRPLWDLPPTSDPEVTTPAAAEQPPAVERVVLPVAEAAPIAVPEPEPVVVAPEPVIPEPVVITPEPVVVAPEPVALQPEPVIVEPEPVIVVEPAPAAEILPEPEPGPIEAPVVTSESAPAIEVVFEPEPVAEVAPEPTLDPEPIAAPFAETAPDPTPEPERTTAPAAEVAREPEPIPEPVAEPEAEPEPTREAEPIAEVAVEPKPIPEPVADATPEPQSEPEPERKPELRIVVAPERVDPAEGPRREDPDALAQPEPEPAAAPEPEPLPDYIVAPDSTAEIAAAPAPPPPPPEPEPEPDLGPLPDYIVDPNRPPQPKAEPEAPLAARAPQPTIDPGRASDGAAVGCGYRGDLLPAGDELPGASRRRRRRCEPLRDAQAPAPPPCARAEQVEVQAVAGGAGRRDRGGLDGRPLEPAQRVQPGQGGRGVRRCAG